jgi:hypothetical protein
LELAGVYRRQEVSRVLRELDVIVVPSLWYENSPNAILESFAHRTPVVASDLGGMTELVREGENGLLFAPGDADDLARQLRRLLDDPHVLSTLRAGISPVKSVAQEMDELDEIYRAVVGNGGRLRSGLDEVASDGSDRPQSGGTVRRAAPIAGLRQHHSSGEHSGAMGAVRRILLKVIQRGRGYGFYQRTGVSTLNAGRILYGYCPRQRG